MHSPLKAEKITGAVSQDSTEKHSGEFSAKIENISDTDTTDIVRWNIKVKPETKYKVSVWVKGKVIVLKKGQGAGAALWASAGPQKDFWGNKNGTQKFMRKAGSFDWTQISMEFTTRKGDEQLILNAQLRLASGTLWVDDVEVVELPK